MQDRLKLPFEALGALRLKNIAWPVEAFALPQSWHEERRAPSFPIPLSDPEQIPRLSVVVLPFRDSSAGGLRGTTSLRHLPMI